MSAQDKIDAALELLNGSDPDFTPEQWAVVEEGVALLRLQNAAAAMQDIPAVAPEDAQEIMSAVPAETFTALRAAPAVEALGA